MSPINIWICPGCGGPVVPDIRFRREPNYYHERCLPMIDKGLCSCEACTLLRNLPDQVRGLLGNYTKSTSTMLNTRLGKDVDRLGEMILNPHSILHSSPQYP